MTVPGTGTSQTSRRPAWRRRTRVSLRVLVVVAVGVPLFLGASASAALGLLLFGTLPGTVPEEKPLPVSVPSTVYDADGNQIGSFHQYDLTLPMTPQDVPEVLKDAVVAAEDRKFWSHNGVDPEGMVRAAWAIYQEGRVVQGASTITQQYARALYLTQEVTLARKLQEAILATRIERELAEELGSKEAAKEEILFRYLDTVYFGGGAYGAASAAATYFRKPVSELTLSEAALLVGVLPSPSSYGPRDNPKVADARRREVLHAMLETGVITQAAHDEAADHALWYAEGIAPPEGAAVTLIYPPPASGATDHPFFVDYVYKYLEARYGSEKVLRGGLRVETTVDPRLQSLAEEAVARGLQGTEWPVDISLVAVEPSTGFVKAFVGGRDFASYQVNLGLGGSTGFQPGSAFKIFTTAAALEVGFDTDKTYPSGPYQPPGCDDDPDGCVSLSGSGGPMGPALASSSNNYFTRLIVDVGPERVAEVSRRLGVGASGLTRHSLGDEVEHYASLTLGAYEVAPLDMASAVATLTNHGGLHVPTPVLRVVAPDGTVLEDNTARVAEQVIHPAIADTTVSLMRGVIEGGTGRAAAIGRPAAGKTGTTDDNRAAWFVGSTPQLAAAVWIGHADQPHPLGSIGGFGEVGGGSIPAQTWARFMGPAMQGQPVVDFVPPGPLPPPGEGFTGARSAGSARRLPEVPADCGGPCVQEGDPDPAPTAQAPPTTAAPAPGGPGGPGSTTTTAVAAPTDDEGDG